MSNIYVVYLTTLDNENVVFAVSKQHDADEVFLSILNVMVQQMDDKPLVGLSLKVLFIVHL